MSSSYRTRVRPHDLVWVNLPERFRKQTTGGPRNKGEYRNDCDDNCHAWLVALRLDVNAIPPVAGYVLAMPTSSTIFKHDYRVPLERSDMWDVRNQKLPNKPCDVLCNEWAALPISALRAKDCYLATVTNAEKLQLIEDLTVEMSEDEVPVFDLLEGEYMRFPEGWAWRR